MRKGRVGGPTFGRFEGGRTPKGRWARKLPVWLLSQPHVYIYIYIYSLTNKHMLHMLHHQQPSAHDKNTSVLKTHALTSFPQPFCRRTSPSAFRGSTWGCPFPAGMKLMCVRGVGVTHALRCSWESRLPFDLVPPGSCHRQKCIQATVPQMGGTILLDDRLSI